MIARYCAPLLIWAMIVARWASQAQMAEAQRMATGVPK